MKTMSSSTVYPCSASPRWSVRALRERLGMRSSRRAVKSTPLMQEFKYRPYVPTHAGEDFLANATPRYMKKLNGIPV